MKLTKTDRGFQLLEFMDLYGNDCELQQSSLAEYEQPGTSAVWLGIEMNRMHLDEAMVKELIRQLQAWLDTGEFAR